MPREFVTGYKELYPNINELIKMYFIIPALTAANEASLSAYKNIKNYLRNK